jgi:CRP-like cAMP-binding protein
MAQTGAIRLRHASVNALDTMRALAGSGEVVDVEPGSVIFHPGERGECMFGLLEGTVDLSWNGDAGHERIQAGDVFGAGALVTQDHRRFGEARAVTACRLLVMNREKFLFAVQESPMFAIELLASIDQRLRRLKDCLRP